MDAQAYLAEAGARVDRYLDEALPRADEPPAALHAAMRHLLFPGGKRLRPALAFAAAEAAGAPPERALPVAGAVELIHTYSLVHDDLPCMDDDDERRGQPTVHVAFGEATAVLAGDALQAAAFGLLAAAPDALVPGVLADLAEAASSRELVGGQSDDLSAGADAEPRAIEDVQRRKTGALFAAAVVGGARLGGAGPELLGRLRRFGEALGVAFQIADDLLDAGGCDAGASLVARIGPEAARARGEAHLARALAEVEGLGARAEPLRELARFAARRDR